MRVTLNEKNFVSFEIRNGILFAEHNDDLIITLPIAKEMVAERIKFQQQANYSSIPIVIKSKVKYANKKAREYLAVEGAEGLIASAFISNSLVTKTLLKIFLTVEKPRIPISVFEDEESAIAWIKKFM